jgi:hypothetical protein
MAETTDQGAAGEVTADDYGKVLGAGRDRVYITKEGDTLGDIAAFFYGDSQHQQRLLDDNPELSPDEILPAGMRLRVSEDAERGDAVGS